MLFKSVVKERSQRAVVPSSVTENDIPDTELRDLLFA